MSLSLSAAEENATYYDKSCLDKILMGTGILDIVKDSTFKPLIFPDKLTKNLIL